MMYCNVRSCLTVNAFHDMYLLDNRIHMHETQPAGENSPFKNIHFPPQFLQLGYSVMQCCIAREEKAHVHETEAPFPLSGHLLIHSVYHLQSKRRSISVEHAATIASCPHTAFAWDFSNWIYLLTVMF